MLDLEFAPPSPRAGQHIRQRWGLARRFPWRYATVQDNDTILVGTENGWRPAKIVGTSPVNDTVDLAFSGEGEELRSVRPRFKLIEDHSATRFEQGVYSELVDGDRIKVETSRGWEIASVIKYHQDDNSLDIEMFPDGERFLHCKPSVVKPHTAPNETALALWADNQRLRRRIAILSSLKAVFTSTAMAKISWYIARHHIDDYEA
ncbi:unnamed protein product [Symbiodinium pilosum]|uniref:Uncharacterized protein n=1 Tax=Symbiodinium pilosum TaxID=2952 RepID=A0A812WG56_SYMPI|nr:unnamed protein product [Symbiodinium pilosum]